MSLTNVLAEDRRGVILRVLVDQGQYALNDGVLQAALAELGHRVSLDVVRGDLAWLREQGLVDVKEDQRVWIATLTRRGEDVAAGNARVPGVKRPEPR